DARIADDCPECDSTISALQCFLHRTSRSSYRIRTADIQWNNLESESLRIATQRLTTFNCKASGEYGDSGFCALE
ncbi:hypothetical protein PFISCL1PPCAC_612, partial [Pristionchus fissidentatus]